MKEHAMATILETWASSLGQEGGFIASARSQLGQEDACTLIPDAGIHLGTVMDDITQRNQGRKSRDFIMFDNEKQLVTGLVQLLANACFQCRQNQDLLRFTGFHHHRQSLLALVKMSKKEMSSMSSCLVQACHTLVSHCENGPSLPSAMLSTTMSLIKPKWPGWKLTNQCSEPNSQAWASE
jgi:hypothetical protein